MTVYADLVDIDVVEINYNILNDDTDDVMTISGSVMTRSNVVTISYLQGNYDTNWQDTVDDNGISEIITVTNFEYYYTVNISDNSFFVPGEDYVVYVKDEYNVWTYQEITYQFFSGAPNIVVSINYNTVNDDTDDVMTISGSIDSDSNYILIAYLQGDYDDNWKNTVRSNGVLKSVSVTNFEYSYTVNISDNSFFVPGEYYVVYFDDWIDDKWAFQEITYQLLDAYYPLSISDSLSFSDNISTTHYATIHLQESLSLSDEIETVRRTTTNGDISWNVRNTVTNQVVNYADTKSSISGEPWRLW